MHQIINYITTTHCISTVSRRILIFSFRQKTMDRFMKMRRIWTRWSRTCFSLDSLSRRQDLMSSSWFVINFSTTAMPATPAQYKFGSMYFLLWNGHFYILSFTKSRNVWAIKDKFEQIRSSACCISIMFWLFICQWNNNDITICQFIEMARSVMYTVKLKCSPKPSIFSSKLHKNVYKSFILKSYIGVSRFEFKQLIRIKHGFRMYSLLQTRNIKCAVETRHYLFFPK